MGQLVVLVVLLSAAVACDSVTPPSDYTAYPQTIGGNSQPIVGDFIGPRTSLRPPVASEGDEIIFYNPAGTTSAVWLGKKGENFPDDNTTWSIEKQTWSTPSNAKPIVGNFAGDLHQDIFWYRSGAAPDLLWVGGVDAFPSQVVTFAVGAIYQPFMVQTNSYDQIFWYAPGTAADSLWNFADNGSGAATPTPQTVNGTFKPIVGHFDPVSTGRNDILWYAPGAAADQFWAGGTRTGWSRKTAMTVGGNYDPVVIGTNRGDIPRDGILWWASGSASESVWVSNSRTLFACKKSVNRSEDAKWVNGGLLMSDGRQIGASYRADGPDVCTGSLQIGIGPDGPAGATPYVGDFFGDSGHSSYLWYGPGDVADSLWVQNYFF
ncbi:hypothetical protein BH10ACT1_BH10ACT1_20420 [soil metagenome]